jgi:competence protein ComEA
MDATQSKPLGTPPPRMLTAISWPRVAELGLAFVLGALTLLLVEFGWRRIGEAGQPATTVEVHYRIDLNHADRGDLAQLPGVGPVLADRIVAYRQVNGPYASVDGLRDVKGVGPATLERLRPRLQVDPAKTLPASGKSIAKEPPAHSRKAPAAQTININRATRAELLTLPGIGPALADRILADREANGPYRDTSELKRVKGIKDKSLEKLLPYITIDDRDAVAGHGGEDGR